MKLRIALLFFVVSYSISYGQSIFTNPITGTNPNTANPYTTGQTVSANMSASGIARGSGITGTNANDRYNANAWSTGSIDLTDYFEFTLTPTSGYQINLVSFVYTGQASGTGPGNFAFRSSVDGYASNIGTATTGTTISLSAGTYQNLTSAITFRLYGWGGSGGTYSVNDFTFNGAVAVVAKTSFQTGDWNVGATWVGGAAPSATDNVIIASSHVVTNTTNITRNSGTVTTVNSGGTLATTASYTNSGTTTINGTFQINAGGYASGTSFVYGSAGILSMNHNNGSSYGISAGQAFWPTSNPPFDVNINNNSPTQLNMAVGAVAGTLTLSSQLNLSTANTINGTLLISPNGYISTQPPVYGNSSTLIYATNYSVGTEWTGNATTAGSGVPKNVTIQNLATVTMPATSRGMAGDLSIASGGLTLNTTFGADLYIAGNWTRASAATFTPNSRAVFFNATSAVDQTINVTGGTSETFNYLTVAGAGTLRPTVALNITSASGLSLSSSNATSTLNLNAQTLTLSGGGNLNLNSGTRLITSTSTGGLFRITSNPITITGGGSVTFAATNVTVDLQNGLDCGASSLATINGKLQINAGGYCFGNSPKYGSASTLQYNTGTNPYNRSLEWTAAPGVIGTVGYPKHVQISNNTKLNYVNATNLGEKGIDGNLTIDAGSALYMNYGSATCGGALVVAGDLNNAGDMVLGFALGDDIKVTGNITFSSPYTFDANKRAVILRGTGTQTISASSKPTFHYMNLDGGASQIVDITCDLDITAPDTGNVISFSNASQVIKLNTSRTLVLGTAAVANSFSATTGSFNATTSSNLTLRGNGSIGTLKFVTSLNLGTLTVDRQNLVNAFTLGTALAVNTSLVMTKGLADLGSQNLTLTATASASGNTNSYVISDIDAGAGRLRKIVTASSGLVTFPIGDASGSTDGSQYAPATVQFASGTFSASTSLMDIAIKDAFHPSIDAASPDRITRYWKITTSGAFNSPNYTFTGTYLDADLDVSANESIFKSGRWNGSEWTEGTSVNTAANSLSLSGLTTLPGTNEFSAGFPLGLGEINVRGNGNDILTADTTPSATDKTDFGKLCADKESTFTIQNVTGARGPLLISGVTITGAHASDFTVSGITTSPALSIAVAGSTTFKVTFNASGDGIRTATVNIASNDSNENPYTFSIQGNGDEEINLKANGDDGGGSASASITNGDMDASQALDYLNNTRFAETDVDVESVSKIYLIENLGTRDLTLSGTPRVVISGTNASDFIVSQIVPLSPANVATCASVSFRIKFKPSSPGDRTAVVTITNSDSDEGSYTFALQGRGREAEIDLKGNNVTIVSGTTATSDANHTKFANTNITSGTATRTYTIYNTGSGSLNVSVPVISGANAADFSVTANPSSTVAATSGTTTFTITFDPATLGLKTATVSVTNSDVDENPYTFNVEGNGINYIECASASVINIGVQDFEDSPATPTWTYSVTGTASKLGGTAYGIDGDSGATPKYIGAKSLQFTDSNDNGTITNSVAEFANISTLNFIDVELSLRIGAFSANSANGMESTDYVLVSVSPDGGSSWSQETRIKGATDNMKWSFSATGSGNASYDNNNTLESGKDFAPAGGIPEYRTTDGYSLLTLTNLPSVANLKVRITMANSHTNETWAIDNVILKGKTNDVKTWDGTNWLDAANGITTAPTSYQKAIIDGDYDSEINGGSIWACEVEVTENGNIIVDANSILDVQSAITNDGTITLENNASLIQYDDFAVISGIINMERHTQPIYRYDYTYWSSPVTEDSAFTLASLSPETLFDKYYSWDAIIQAWSLNYGGTESMVPGKGYIIRAPQPFPFEPVDAIVYEDGIFAGEPNNGEITYAINGSTDPGTDIWNLIGNPYPCALNIEKFFDIATGNRDVLDGTLYFWTHNTPVEANAYANSDYASYNFTGGVGTAAGDGSNQNVPNGYVAAGQAFFVKGLSNGADTVFFNNSMRGGVNNQFFRNAPAAAATTTEGRESHRIWLNITAAQGGFNQTLLGYIQGATNDIDWGFDGTSFSGNNVSLYSMTNDKKFTIQGRALPFTDQDLVQMGYTSTSAGSLTIKIDHVDGLFDSQNIYLEDLLLNTIHDLKNAPYTFTTLAGTFDERFVLRYTNSTLGVEPINVDNGLIVFKEKKQLQFLSQSEAISDIAVFDLSGRLIYQKKAINANSFSANGVSLNQQVLIVKVKMANGTTVTRKVIY